MVAYVATQIPNVSILKLSATQGLKALICLLETAKVVRVRIPQYIYVKVTEKGPWFKRSKGPLHLTDNFNA